MLRLQILSLQKKKKREQNNGHVYKQKRKNGFNAFIVIIISL